MAAEIVMPRLSDSMEEGTILRWIKSPGDEVAVGDELVEIETDKANMVYEADEAGTLVEIVAAEGDTLPIGEVIARVGEPGEVKEERGDIRGSSSASTTDEGDGDRRSPSPIHGSAASPGPRVHAAEAPPPASPSPAPADAPADGPSTGPPETAAPGDGRVKASPLARRMAREKGLDLGALAGSGPGGRIVKADVERAESEGAVAGAAQAAAPPPAGPTPGARERPETARGEAQVVELTKLQKTVARRMAESKATAPHFYLECEVDMTRCVEARTRLKASASEGEVVPSLNDMIVKAVALALRAHPRANGAYRDGRLELYSRVNVGVAVAAQEALVVPTIFDADRKGLRAIATEARALAARVREGSVTPPELSGGTFTVSNLGMFGITSFAAVINPPQAGILAVGAVSERPIVRDGELTSAQLMGLNLACDHRILYGADGARFLGAIRDLLEEPLGLAL